MLLPEIVIAAKPTQAIAPGSYADNQTELPQSDAPAAFDTSLQAAEANAPIASDNARGTARDEARDAARSGDAEPFGLAAEPVVDGEILAKWDGVEAEIEQDNRVLAQCRKGGFRCPSAARRFLSIISDGQARNGRARIGVINREINLSIVPTTDLAQWGVADRWSAPLETFTTRRGDCEDYAIAKYVALGAAGVPQQDIRVIVVRNKDLLENHAVVAVRIEGDWIILDNRWLALVRDLEMRRATPLFELDENGVRRFVDPAVLTKLQAARSGSS